MNLSITPWENIITLNEHQDEDETLYFWHLKQRNNLQNYLNFNTFMNGTTVTKFLSCHNLLLIGYENGDLYLNQLYDGPFYMDWRVGSWNLGRDINCLFPLKEGKVLVGTETQCFLVDYNQETGICNQTEVIVGDDVAYWVQMFTLPMFGLDEMQNALVCCLTYDYVLILRVNDTTIHCLKKHPVDHVMGGFHNILSSQVWINDNEGGISILDVHFY